MPNPTDRLGGRRAFVLAKEVRLENRFLEEWDDRSGGWQGAPPGWDSRAVTSYMPASMGMPAWPCRPHGGMFAMHYVQTGYFSLFEARASLTIDPSSNPEFFATGTHSMIAGVHLFPFPGSGIGYTDHISVTLGGSKINGTVDAGSFQWWKQSCLYPRWQGGGDFDERYWTGSQAATIHINGTGNTTGAWGLIDNLIVGMDCIELLDHPQASYSGGAKRAEHLSQGGRMYGLTFHSRERWKIPLDNLSSIDWTRVNSWVFNGHNLVLGEVITTSGGGVAELDVNWLRRVAVVNKATPAGSLVPGNVGLRKGYIELEESLEGM